MTNSVDVAVEGRQSARLNFVVSQGQVANAVLIHLQAVNIDATGNGALFSLFRKPRYYCNIIYYAIAAVIISYSCIYTVLIF